MKIDITKKYRYGRMPAIIHSITGPDPCFPIIASIQDEEGDWEVNDFSADANFIEVREPREFWIIESENGVRQVYECEQTLWIGMTPYPNQIRVREIID